MGPTGPDRRVRRGRRHVTSGSDSASRPTSQVLPSFLERNLWRAAGNTSAKAYAHFIVRSYRYRYGLHASSGILYNHESERRPLQFLPRKVAHGAAAISLGLSAELWLGDLDARRDWGYAGDYVRAMWSMLQRDEPDDFVIATGVPHSVEELVACAFGHLGLDWRTYVHIDESLQRGRAELHDLVGDPSKARDLLGWEPTLSFEDLVRMLVDKELERLRCDPMEASQLRG
jgi:GDPmannose 4,6-dehydratase